MYAASTSSVNKNSIIIGVVIAGAVVFVALLLACFCRRKRTNQPAPKKIRSLAPKASRLCDQCACDGSHPAQKPVRCQTRRSAQATSQAHLR
jgi:hypothetical protein